MWWSGKNSHMVKMWRVFYGIFWKDTFSRTWIFQLSFLDQTLLAIKDQIPHHFFEKLELRKKHLKIGLWSAHKNNTVNSVKSFKNSLFVFLLLETMNMLCCPNIFEYNFQMSFGLQGSRHIWPQKHIKSYSDILVYKSLKTCRNKTFR